MGVLEPGGVGRVNRGALAAAFTIYGVATLGLVGLAAGCAKMAPSLQDESRIAVASLSQARSSIAGRHDRSAKGARQGESAARAAAAGRDGMLLGAIAPRHPVAETPLDQLLGEGDRPLPNNGLCPPDMASIDDRFCVDKYEGSLVELLPNGDERAWSPFQVADGRAVRAVSEPHVYPQGYISGNQAAEACSRSGKRLCKPEEWRQACMGPSHATWGYGEARQTKRCNDHGRSSMGAIYGGGGASRSFWATDRMNNPALNQVPGTLAKTGDHEACTNDYGVYDMVGNLHEWVDDPKGTFQGGYYLDTQINGDGCTYRTMAHEAWYHDYSTGFRCCSDPAP